MRWLWTTCLLVWGCGEFPPFEPGSDLPDPAPPAVTSARPDASLPDATAKVGSDISGNFTIVGELVAVGMPIAVDFLGVFTQDGEIDDGAAMLQLELREAEDPEREGPSFPEPVAVDAEGGFKGTVLDLVIPVEFSDLLLEDANADVEFDGVVRDSDCVQGLLGLQLKDALTAVVEMPLSIRLDGSFRATREGATCDFD